MKRSLLVLGGVLVLAAGAARAEDKIDFAKQIRPIFADSCYKCHAGQKHKGDLKLDSVEAFQKGGKDGKVLEPGQPDKSDLYRRIVLPKGDDDVMPPKGDPLPKEKTDLVKQWIAQGADFGDWKGDKVEVASTTQASAEEGPKEIQLPQVPAADVGAVKKINDLQALCMIVAQNTNLLDVNFSSLGDKAGDNELALLAPLAEQVYDLNLARSKVTDSGLSALENLKNLRKLHLEKTQIGDAGLAHLKNLTNLEYLNLYGTNVTDSGLSQLEGLKKLRNVYLWQSKVTAAGAEALRKAIPGVHVDLGWEEPAKADAKAEAKS